MTYFQYSNIMTGAPFRAKRFTLPEHLLTTLSVFILMILSLAFLFLIFSVDLIDIKFFFNSLF